MRGNVHSRPLVDLEQEAQRSMALVAQAVRLSATSRATSSERRNAPAKPRRTKALSRFPRSVSGDAAIIALTCSASAGALWTFAVPNERRMPLRVALTASASVGVAVISLIGPPG